jgi:hypothetical protein
MARAASQPEAHRLQPEGLSLSTTFGGVRTREALFVILSFTPLMKKRLTRRAQTMIERSLQYFPELNGKNITVGYTRAHLGSASLSYPAGKKIRLIIRLKVRKLSYQTIGHELTHLVQGLSRGNRRVRSGAITGSIPSGEKQCDIWTLARDQLFCDDAPTYLRLPRATREHWLEYAEAIRQLCIAAIEKRKRHRLYIHWLESQIRRLTKTQPPAIDAPRQLPLPFSEPRGYELMTDGHLQSTSRLRLK